MLLSPLGQHVLVECQIFSNLGPNLSESLIIHAFIIKYIQNYYRYVFGSLACFSFEAVSPRIVCLSGDKQTCSDPSAFAGSLTSYFDTMRHAESWSDTNYSSASDALSAILELVRQHEVRVESVAYSGTHW